VDNIKMNLKNLVGWTGETSLDTKSETDDGPSGTVKYGEFFDYMKTY
jgi:hypothetical protein